MAKEQSISVIIADDHKLFRSGLISLLSDVDDIEIIAEATNGRELVEKYFELRPQVILVDISMPVLSGIEALKIIKKKNRKVRAIFLTMYEGEEYVFYAMRVKAKGLLSKNTLKDELIHAIKTVASGDSYFGKDYPDEKLSEIQKKYMRSPIDEADSFINISRKEREILQLISKGMTSNEIAEKLFMSKRTVDYHRTKLMQKLNIKSLPELISFSIKYSSSSSTPED